MIVSNYLREVGIFSLVTEVTDLLSENTHSIIFHYLPSLATFPCCSRLYQNNSKELFASNPKTVWFLNRSHLLLLLLLINARRENGSYLVKPPF